jgi:hypothetical protein
MRNRQIDQIHGGARLLEMVRENEGELPGVAPFLAPLEKFHAQVVSSRDQREKLAAASREATKQLNENLAAANEAAIALRSYIKGVLGIRSPKLTRYGMKPRRRRGCPRKHLAS